MDAAGVEPTAPVEVIHDRPWSTVLRVPTDEGDLFLKQEAPLQAFEVPLTLALASRWPDRMPAVVAADVERAWLLLRDGGVRVADSCAYDVFEHALRLYGELQVGEVPHADELLGLRLPDVRLDVITDAYEPFFERDHGLTGEEVGTALALGPRYRELCEELAAVGLPATIQHDDLHQWNVFARGDRVGIYDWGDSSIAFPLWSWLKPFLALTEAGIDPEPTRRAYLSAWTDFASEVDLRRALELAIPTGFFAYCFQIRRQYDLTQAHAEYKSYLPMRLRQFLAALQAA